jgi:uncharacterized membrane protein YbhN (UPF0104 family)
MFTPGRRHWIITVGAILIAAVIAWRLYLSAQGKSEFVFQPQFILAALGFSLLQKALGPFLIMASLKSISQKSRYIPLLWITMFATAANSAVPFPAGIPIRAVLQKKVLGIPYTVSASGLVIETAIAYGCTVIMCFVTATVWLAPVLKTRISVLEYPLLMTVMVLGILLSFGLAYLIARRLKGRLIQKIQDVSKQILNARYDMLGIALGIVLASYIVSLLRFEMLLKAMGLYIPPGPLLAAMIFSYLAGVISFVPMGLGVRDVSLGSLLVFLGMPVESAAAAAAIDRILISSPCLAGGIIAVYVMGSGVRGQR